MPLTGGLWQAFIGHQKTLHYPLFGPHLSANASVGSYCAFCSKAASVLPVLAEGAVCFSPVQGWRGIQAGADKCSDPGSCPEFQCKLLISFIT